MKKSKVPQSNMPGIISEALFPQPAKPLKSEDKTDSKAPVNTEMPANTFETETKSDSSDIKEKLETKSKAAAKKIRVVTYCSEENYTLFEKAFSDVKSQFRVHTGKKMAETHFAEIAMMAGIELFLKNPEAFVTRIVDQNKKK